MSQNNILDSPVPNVKTPILKPQVYKAPVKPYNVKKLKDIAKSNLNKFADWFLNFIPEEKKKIANERIKKLQSSINKIFNQHKVTKKASAFKGFLTSYEIKGQAKVDPKIYFQRHKVQVLNLLKEKEKPVKFKMVLEVEFKKKNIYSISYFHSDIEIITETSKLKEIYERNTERMLEKIEVFQNMGSGWIFNKVILLSLHIDKYNPISGSSYIPLPRKLALKRSIVNPKNKDLECFKWAATLAVIKPEGKNKERISNELKKNTEELNWYGLTFPVELPDIDTFEEKNSNVSVNVFGFNETKEEVFPLRISETNGERET